MDSSEGKHGEGATAVELPEYPDGGAAEAMGAVPPPPLSFSSSRSSVDVGFASLWREARVAWRENPICRFVWRRLRPYTITLTCFYLVYSLSGLAYTALAAPTGVAFSAQDIIYMGLNTIIGIGVLAAYLAAPLVYARWVYRLTYTQDDQLRLTLLSRRERLVGVMVPPLVAICVAHLPSLLLGPITMLFMDTTAFPMEGLAVVVLMGAATFLESVSGTALYGLVFVTVALRRMIQHGEMGAYASKGWPYVAVPYLIWLGLVIVRGCGVGIFSGALMAGLMVGATGGAGPVMPGALTPVLIVLGSTGYVVLVVLFLCLSYVVYSRLWQADAPVARAFLFDSREVIAGAPVLPVAIHPGAEAKA